jgi:hypothetical protein
MAKSIAIGASLRLVESMGSVLYKGKSCIWGEINDGQKAAWCKTIEAIRENHGQRVQSEEQAE